MAMRGKRVRGSKGGDVRIVGLGPSAPITYSLDGYTRDYDTRAIIPSCTVHLFRTSDDLEIAQTTSNGLGYFNFSGLPDNTTNYYIVAYLTGVLDQAGTTLNTLVAA